MRKIRAFAKQALCLFLLSLVTISLADEPEKQDLFLAGADGVAAYRIPAIATTNKGTLIVIADARVSKNRDLPNNIDLVMRRSTNSGAAWEPMKVILDYPGLAGVGDPCIVVDRDTGTIWVFALYGPKGIGLFASKVSPDEQRAKILAVKSDDDGRTWSKPVILDGQANSKKWFCALASPGSAIQMRDGVLVVPGYYRPDKGRRMNSFIFYSTDHGKTWRFSDGPNVKGSQSASEAAVIELNDGSLMLNMRNHYKKGCRAVSTTRDMGKTWSEITFAKALPEPVCQASMIRYTSTRDGYDKDRIVFSNPSKSRGRTSMTVKMSYDEGKTWPVSRTIHTGPSAYSCMTILADGSIGLFYEHGDKKSPYEKMKFLRFSLAWLTDSKDKLGKPYNIKGT